MPPIEFSEPYISEFNLARYMPYSLQALRQWRIKGKTPPPMFIGKSILYRTDQELKNFIEAEWRRKGQRKSAA